MKPSSSTCFALAAALYLLANPAMAAGPSVGAPRTGAISRPPAAPPAFHRGGGRHFRPSQVTNGFVVPNGFWPDYGYGYGYGAPPSSPTQQVFVQPVVSQTTIVNQGVAPAPYRVQCGGPQVIEVRPSRRTSAAPRVIYGSPDPCGQR